MGIVFFFFFKQKTAYEMQRGLVGSEMCIRDRYIASVLASVTRDGTVLERNEQRAVQRDSLRKGNALCLLLVKLLLCVCVWNQESLCISKSEAFQRSNLANCVPDTPYFSQYPIAILPADTHQAQTLQFPKYSTPLQNSLQIQL
eukprot:TRINITY_DN10772_c0_g1_i3.p3 TRINITY_DN10772_c0_g1~~TRINITY_DN10772_c0_g1_i3.p3  ORF type:complete len:144 (+),score=21.76 TRINITY_DN10772_c0_g1_i3:108-539(+)